MSIEKHEFIDYVLGSVLNADEAVVSLEVEHADWFALYKSDVIALAKHFKLNTHDIQCSEHIALQKYCAQLEDEIIDIQTTINNTSKRLS